MYDLSILDHQEQTIGTINYNKKILKNVTTISQQKHIRFNNWITLFWKSWKHKWVCENT